MTGRPAYIGRGRGLTAAAARVIAVWNLLENFRHAESMIDEKAMPEPARQQFGEASAREIAQIKRTPITLHVDAEVADWFAALPDANREIEGLLRFYMETGSLGLDDNRTFRHIMEGPDGGMVEMYYDANDELHCEGGPAVTERNALGDVEVMEWWRHGVKIEPAP